MTGETDPIALPPAPSARGQLTDRGALALAGIAALGAWWHHPWPLALSLAVAVVALVVRRPVLLCLAAFLLAGTFGARSFAGLTPVSPTRYSGPVTLVADPQRTPYGIRVDVRLGHRRLELSASGSAVGAVEASLAGERLLVEGRVAPPRPGADWLVPRHVVGRLTVDRAERRGSGTAPWRAANRFRRLLERGSEGMPQPSRALYAGFVLGDDRDQPAEIVDDFRGAGLTHLLVVSGQNVAFLLVLLGPVLGRLRWRGRWLITIGVIVAFGLVTRFEPSVLRASAMSALAVTAGAMGRPSGAVRNLALAVTVLVLVDPLLVRSIGFQLSVGASLAIALLAIRIAALLPGPRLLAEAMGVTLAAQIGVAPILIPRFGGLPVVSLLANPLTVPVAGLVTSWGLPAGVIAGLARGWVATLIHLPTVALIRWVAFVARVGAWLPLGQAVAGHVVAVAGLGVAAASVRTVLVRRIVVGAAIVVLLLPAFALRAPPPEVQLDGAGVFRADGATVVVADRSARASALLEGLRLAGVRRIDALVVDLPNPEDLVRSLRHRWSVGAVVDVRSGRPTRLAIGPFVITAGGSEAASVEGPGGRIEL